MEGLDHKTPSLRKKDSRVTNGGGISQQWGNVPTRTQHEDPGLGEKGAKDKMSKGESVSTTSESLRKGSYVT